MATKVARRSKGATVVGSTSCALTAPAGSVGDMLIAHVGTRHTTTTAAGPDATPSGWNLLGTRLTTLGAAVGNDVGDVGGSLYYRVADGTAADNPTFAFTGGNLIQGLIHRYYQTDGGTSWSITSSGGADSTTGSTTIAVTAAADIGLAADDLLLQFLTLNTDSTTSAASISTAQPTATGATIAAVSSNAYDETSTGNDIAMVHWDAEVTAGPSSAALVFSSTCAGTNGANLVGTVQWVRLRPIAKNVDPSSIASAEAFGTPTIAKTLGVTGIASAQAFGTPSLAKAFDVTGIASAQAFGTPTLAKAIDVTGIASAQALGTPTIVKTLGPTGIASGEAFGTPTVVTAAIVSASGIASAEAFGTPSLAITIGVAGIASAEAFGLALVREAVMPRANYRARAGLVPYRARVTIVR